MIDKWTEELKVNDQNAGKGDVSGCLLAWIKKIKSHFENKESCTLSETDVGNLLHTLLCAKIRVDRIVTERDILKVKLLEVEIENRN